LIEWMSSIPYLSGRLVPELLQLRPDIVNSAPRGRIRGDNSFCCNNVG
jgi:hypothetical protein